VQGSDATDASTRDADIVDLIRRGAHAEGFELLLGRYERRLYRLCLSLLREPAQAEDAAQESFVRIWKALPTYDGRASLSTWSYTIARNRCLTALQRRRDEATLSDPEIAVEAEAAAAQAATDPDDRGQLLRELVDALPERYRRTLTLFYYEERSVPEVAAMLGIPEGTVKTNLFRARGLLLGSLEQLGLADANLWREMAA
jgi:RNA polymerase sigma-70 factor (ECF subfamily)